MAGRFKFPVAGTQQRYYCCCGGACPFCFGCPTGGPPYTFQFTVEFTDPVTIQVLFEGTTYDFLVAGLSGLNGTYAYSSNNLTGNIFEASGFSNFSGCPAPPLHGFGCQGPGATSWGCDVAGANWNFGWGMECWNDTPGKTDGCFGGPTISAPAIPGLCNTSGTCVGPASFGVTAPMSCPLTSLSASGSAPTTDYCLLNGVSLSGTVRGTP